MTETKRPKKADYVVQRGFWTDAGGENHKVEKGAIVTLSAEDAIDAVENGILKKATK